MSSLVLLGSVKNQSSMKTVMWNDLPMPQKHGSLKIWPVHSRAEYKYFIAYDSKPYYFKSWNEAVAFVKEVDGDEDASGD